MKRHLKYIDGNSDKFWQIEVSGVQFTVTYGKNGTSGVSQTKSFATEDESLKTAEKLLAEKIKKGYSENGEVIATTASTTVKQGKKNDTNVFLKEYDQIIKSRNIAQLLPFLQENAKGNVEVLKNHIKKCKRYWMTYIDLNEDPEYKTREKYHWGTRGDKTQIEIISLSAVALFNKTDIAAWDEVVDILRNADKPHILEILLWAKPNWTTAFILDKIKKQDWMTFDYQKLRFLESKEIISYNPELFAICLASFNDWNATIKTPEYIKYIVGDKTACERDVPELFNYETNLQNSFYRINDTDKYNENSTWELGYKSLLAEKKMAIPFFVENALLIQTKEWNNNLKSFYRKRIDELNLTAEDLIPFQDNIFPFLHNPYPPITTYGMELIKVMQEHPKFKAKAFIEWLEPTMMRSDCKAAIKLALPVLEKLVKANPKLSKTVANIIADVFMIADLNLQERAAKILVKTASKKDTELSDKLSSYAALIQSPVKGILSTFFDEELLAVDEATLEAYTYNSQKAKVLLEEVTLPKDWNDIVYQFGSFITSDEVLDTEILLNAYITQRHLFPGDFTKQLQPYEKQLDKSYFEAIHKSFAAVFFEHKVKTIVGRIKIIDNSYSELKTLKLINLFINKVQDKIDISSTIPLLSFPTHKPHWVAPKVLLERIIEHQKSQESIMAVDLAVAIARMPRENIEEALPLLEEINGEIKDIMAFCLGVTKEIKIETGSLLNRFISTIGIPWKNNEIIAFWAVAARTFYPEETFEIFEKTHLKGIPFVAKPLEPEFFFKEEWYESVNYFTKKKERSPSWYELRFKMPDVKAPDNPLLYSLDIYKREWGWYHMLNFTGNTYYWHSLMPQNNDPLAYTLLRTVCRTADGSNPELTGYLNIVNQPGFTFSNATLMTFACCFFQEKKEVRLLAAEVLINLIENRTVDIEALANKMAFLASNRYGVFQRLAEGLATLKDVSALHNHALYLLMDTVFKNLDVKDKLPTNFKKIVENYVDVLSKTNQKPSPEALTFFRQWKDNATLKSLLKEIIK
ncbi:DUF6493 family protein [Flavobacterium terrisoli]|uniref:DUF6493 family protein n=1 Tax=Flavobacterium terrisoli TaxID=3242195 RepID=UPI0025439212|nr:DUF6493 family protein [Flavobacterium buctense]